MTAKRFEVWKTIGSFQCWHIEDTINDKVVCDHIIHKYEADRLCSCLNELHEENQRLKKENNSLIDGIKNTAKQGADLSTKIWQSKNTATTITGRYYD